MRRKWAILLIVVAAVLAAIWALPFALPGRDLGLDELDQLAGVASLAIAVAGLLVGVWALRDRPATSDAPGTGTGSGTANTVHGDVTGQVVQAEQIHSGPVYGGDHVDLSGGTVHARFVGTEEHHHHPHPPRRTRAPHSLPTAPSGFAGRRSEVRELLRRLDPGAGSAGPPPSNAVVVSALSGMGGIGKTALALHTAGVAHGRGWFCAELFVDLHGFTPGMAPLDAAAALGALLRQLGVDADDIPGGVEERAALYRSALHTVSQEDPAGRPVLVLADNASRSAQIEPLLPGPGAHRLLVTSRERLAVDGHRPMSLGLLTGDEAAELLTGRLGGDDPRSRDRDGLAALAERCGLLPLALKIAAALLARAPHLEPGHLAQRLSGAAAFEDGSHHLPTVFAASLDHLPADQVQAFALLGSSPGPDISTTAAAVLTGLAPDRLVKALEGLAAAHLLTPHPGGRWSMHDLLADHARALGPPPESADLREQQVKRLLGFYSMTALEADKHVYTGSGDPSEAFPDRGAALAWLDAERENLIASVHAARRMGLTAVPVHLAFSLKDHLEVRRYFDEALDVLTVAREVARETARTEREAHAWNMIGGVLLKARRFDDSVEARYRARALCRQVGDIPGEAAAWNGLGFALRELERFDEAITALNRAQDLFRFLGDRQGEAMAAGNIGATLHQQDRTKEAIATLRHANTVFHQVGDRGNEGSSATNLGAALQRAGRTDEAVATLHCACSLLNGIDTAGEALAWTTLGVVQAEAGRYSAAAESHERAHDLFHGIGDPYGEAVSLNNLGLAMMHLNESGRAADAFRQARDLYRQTDDLHGEAHAARYLGDALQEGRRLDEAGAEFERSIELHRQTGHTACEGGAWNALGLNLLLEDRFEEAVVALTRAISMLHRVGDETGEAGAWNNLAHALEKTGRDDEARRARERAVRMYRSIDTPFAREIAARLSDQTR